MEDPRWLRLLTAGLVLAAIAIGYFLFTGRFASNSVPKKISQTNRVAVSPSPTSYPYTTATPTPKPVLGQITRTTPAPSRIPTSSSAYNLIASRTQGQVVQGVAGQATKGGKPITLPRTGFPLDLVAILSVSVMISGWGLRRFPK